MVLILCGMVIFFMGLVFGVGLTDRDLRKDVKSGTIKVDHIIYKVERLGE